MDIDQAIVAWTDRLRAAIKRDGRTVDAIARKARVSPSTAARLLNPQPSRRGLDGPRLRTLLALTAELGVSPATWLKGLGGRS